MSVQIRTPNITAATDRERLMQIQSYLYQMAQQLQWAFDTIQTGSGGGGQPVVQQTKTIYVSTNQDPETTFAGIKDLIIKSAEIVDAYYEEIDSRLDGIYVAKSDFGTYTEQTRTSTRILPPSISCTPISGHCLIPWMNCITAPSEQMPI